MAVVVSRQKALRLLLPLIGLLLSLVSSSLSSSVFLLLVATGALLGLGLSPRVWYRLLVLLLFVVLGVLPLIFEYSEQGLLGGWEITRDGIALASKVALRCLSAVLYSVLLVWLYPFYELCRDLRTLGVPQLLLQLIELSYRYIQILLGLGQQIYEAQRLRLGYVGYLNRFRHLSLLFSRTLAHSYHESGVTYEGLVSRGFEHDASKSNTEDILTLEAEEGLLRLDRVSYTYDNGEQVLRELSLHLGLGERIVLLGANGAGKSTLMRLLSGLAREQEGKLYWRGQQLGKGKSDLTKQRRSIAWVMQNASHQLFCASVEDEIAFGLRNSGLAGEALNTKVEEQIVRFGLEALRHATPQQLSEGQKKWVSLAAVLALDPELILLDEPTASLDYTYTQKILELLDELHKQGKTILLSTHDMELAYRWGDRAILLASGQLIYDGNMDTLFGDEKLLLEAHIARPYSFRASQNNREDPADYSLALMHRGGGRALIIGGGQGAFRKIKTLDKAQWHCTIITPEIIPELTALLKDSKHHYISRCFLLGESLDGYDLVVVATNCTEMDAKITQQALRAGKLVDNLSAPGQGNVQFLAQDTRGGVTLAIHSCYRLPRVTVALRDRWLNELGSLVSEEELIALAHLRREDKKGASYSSLNTRILDRIEQNT